MHQSLSSNFEQKIVLEIKSDSHSFAEKAIEFIDNGIRLIITSKNKQATEVTCPHCNQNLNITQELTNLDNNNLGESSKIIFESQDKSTLLLASRDEELQQSIKEMNPQLISVGTQTALISQPKIVILNKIANQQTSNSHLIESTIQTQIKDNMNSKTQENFRKEECIVLQSCETQTEQTTSLSEQKILSSTNAYLKYHQRDQKKFSDEYITSVLSQKKQQYESISSRDYQSLSGRQFSTMSEFGTLISSNNSAFQAFNSLKQQEFNCPSEDAQITSKSQCVPQNTQQQQLCLSRIAGREICKLKELSQSRAEFFSSVSNSEVIRQDNIDAEMPSQNSLSDIDISESGSQIQSEILYVDEAPFLPKKCSLSSVYNLSRKMRVLKNKESSINKMKVSSNSKKIIKDIQAQVKKKKIYLNVDSNNSPQQIQQKQISQLEDFKDSEFNQSDLIIHQHNNLKENSKKTLNSEPNTRVKKKKDKTSLSSPTSKYRKYQCKFCKKRFRICAALGGHISKAHPGQSSAYNHKKQVREQRELERQLHKDAMNFYFENFNNVQGLENNVLNRNTIKRIKKMLVYKEDQYQSLREKFLVNKEDGTEHDAQRKGSQTDQDDSNEEITEPSILRILEQKEKTQVEVIKRTTRARIQNSQLNQ
ncbi:UNKNOWN [Stylonychia lemnae]|uniref:C2H2-type domain-containing protein n=1 Tax=Stylonychia lemnae TaxID=5949 RepID=A0A078ASG0_STYLE|nr:UNKNOWN [Stylonychia lemnae]|eukprot:CDW84157.1 UNKNOWN [Stylonychia lemnae]